jgi:hypothetical protein
MVECTSWSKKGRGTYFFFLKKKTKKNKSNNMQINDQYKIISKKK